VLQSTGTNRARDGRVAFRGSREGIVSWQERRLVIDQDFESVLGKVTRALGEEGLQVIARIDLRHHFRNALRHDFRRYMLLEAWSPELAFEALEYDLALGPTLPAALAVYELNASETAVVLPEYLPAVHAAHARPQDAPGLSRLVAQERDRVGRALERMEAAGPPEPSGPPAR
jgi:uncharacterized protein (DUF302 family)